MDASQESLNSVDSLSDDSCPRSVVSTLATSYASPSILLNPLPPSNKARKTQLVSHHASPPPASFKGLYSSSAPNPPPLDRTASANSSIVSSALTTGAESIAYSQHSAGGRPLCRADTQSTAGSVITFAPLPPGRSRYRSNSLTIGVAARAQMIASQGGGSHMARPRYAGPQQWYQPGAVQPADVYTYKDATAALGKVWGKLRKKNGSSSKSDQVAAALAIEREGKIGGAEDEERIEDVIHEHDDEHLEDGHHYSPHLPDLRGRTSNPSSHHTLSREDLLPPHPHQPTDRERSVTSSDRRSEDSSVVATPEDSDVELAKRGVRNGKQKELESNSRQAML